MANPAYFVFDVKINDPEGIKPYQAKVAETYVPYGGQPIVASGKVEVLEGKAPNSIIVILQFPSMEQAHAWHESPEYQAILGYRQAASESNAYLVEGIAPVI
ncbi:DUF1330 domain-containing protein [Prodigiosinella confusarubida]|uniref:DUF1330 domain-containing protein n=1 Tax=Serratia sp. (strain ATCC 39006) TaxID=104623 RepID=A0A2I5TNU7_SERS3|nr:DUF1330 domain-containing protein [Serratia sp. ATCC 39006]AUH01919.1 DUF1330 domain-containing protein [Serratia sp. ATCC 39006]AUH06241.1 DUF1330 domain-containing protein [Serratia sp. ATCC 39006]